VKTGIVVVDSTMRRAIVACVEHGAPADKAGLRGGSAERSVLGRPDVVQGGDVIVAVNGAAVGIGMTMILPFDVIVASDRAKFGMFFVKVGLVPELASTHFLVQRIGFGRASEMCLTAGLYRADEAHRMGLADRVVAHDELVPAAVELASQMASNPDPMLRMTKRLLTANAVDTDLEAVQARESEYIRECWKSPEHREAVEAFLAR